MQSCELSCKELVQKTVKVNFFDKVLGRTLEEKIGNICHLDCLKSLNIKNLKKNGRWGFRPVLGMTEMFSSILALFSFYLTISGYNRKLKPKLHKSQIEVLYYIQYYVANAAFVSSFMFHARETWFTRYADYFTAFASILAGLLVALNRLVLLKKPSISKQFSILSGKIAVVYFVFHVYKMTAHEFDYVYNKIACGSMFFTYCFCFFLIFLNYKEHAHSKQIIYSIGCLLAAGGVEVLDIAPVLYLFDSHALWHLLMALSAPFYIEFLFHDIDCQSNSKKKRKGKKVKKQDNLKINKTPPS
ncbi:hypothetical protein GINT2_000884 [Glugoides intestinalis]